MYLFTGICYFIEANVGKIVQCMFRSVCLVSIRSVLSILNKVVKVLVKRIKMCGYQIRKQYV